MEASLCRVPRSVREQRLPKDLLPGAPGLRSHPLARRSAISRSSITVLSLFDPFNASTASTPPTHGLGTSLSVNALPAYACDGNVVLSPPVVRLDFLDIDQFGSFL